MLLETAANRLQAHLLAKFADYSVSCTGLCFTFRGEGQTETPIYQYAAPQGDRITLDDRVDVQFIILDLSGTYETVMPSRGRGNDYRRQGRLALVAYVSDTASDAIAKIEPALASLYGFQLTSFEERPQNVASQYLFLTYDFKFTRPLIAFELQVSERTAREGCVTLPTEVCAGVEIVKDGQLVQVVPSGGAYIYETGPSGDVLIIDVITGETIATVPAGQTYPVLQLSGIADEGGNYTTPYIIADPL